VGQIKRRAWGVGHSDVSNELGRQAKIGEGKTGNGGWRPRASGEQGVGGTAREADSEKEKREKELYSSSKDVAQRCESWGKKKIFPRGEGETTILRKNVVGKKPMRTFNWHVLRLGQG